MQKLKRKLSGQIIQHLRSGRVGKTGPRKVITMKRLTRLVLKRIPSAVELAIHNGESNATVNRLLRETGV